MALQFASKTSMLMLIVIVPPQQAPIATHTLPRHMAKHRPIYSRNLKHPPCTNPIIGQVNMSTMLAPTNEGEHSSYIHFSLEMMRGFF